MFHVSRLGVEKLKFDYLKNDKSFRSGTKNMLLFFTGALFRLTKPTGQNVVDTIRPSGAEGAGGLSVPTMFFVDVPFFRRAFEISFLKEVTKNVDEN